ncbi:Arabinose 5-phosphate isomerase KdsD [Anaerobiospirillum thomasii]|uniref:Arabinose 5-phosphate isomerase n=1 Tax=Anaerobiospirillum thomasii TaxID=179995 RepID=A0A2X0VH16_9GAMM|nr:KpsF/GutQ family sugar-phosphate isomerase [Anaerobiospirillum thomasii]SPT69103.1 Arabinose 5-phosphate isomerase KdsD [Anaerobiospirillum thomasii]SPT72345.1 Arabinose 5-phosphate isomerase KdsD [Anaerobiospirillum thomasii]
MLTQKCIEAGRRVLQEEAQALLNLKDSIDDNFVNACKILLACKGKVVLTGVGKSGHIASKIASTLASTGTQSFFVQAGEAAHGDLGMIGTEDVVIATSHSGEGSELKVMIPILKRRQIPLIAITGNVKSSLAQASDVCLSAHVEKEACPLNLAPTSSSTAELAIGDALAVALIEARGFTERDFALYHPGGALGRKLLVRCGDIMHKGKDLPIIKTGTSIQDTLIEMTQKRLGMVCVVDEQGYAVGVYTDGDVRRTLEKNISIKDSIDTIMTNSFASVHEQTLAADALAQMQNKKILAMLVIDDSKKPIGAFNMHDLLQAGII